MTASMKENLTWEKLKPQVMQSYRDSFSDTELETILAFYTSPTGQAYLTRAPQIAGKSCEAAEAKVRELGGMFNVMGKEWSDQHPKPAAPAK